MKLVLTDANFKESQSRVVEMLKERKSGLESSIRGSGHSAINTRMNARYRVGGYISEIMGGVSQLDTVRDLLKQAEDDWPSLLARLENMRKVILDDAYCRDGMVLDVTGDKTVLEKIQPSVDEFLKTLPGKSEIKNPLPNFYKEEH